MPLPSPKGKQDRKSFVSDCVSKLSKKGEGESIAQRVAICNSRWEKSKASDDMSEDEDDELEDIKLEDKLEDDSPIRNVNITKTGLNKKDL